MAQLLISIGSAWKKAGDPARGHPDLEKAKEMLDAFGRDQPENATSRFLSNWANLQVMVEKETNSDR